VPGYTHRRGIEEPEPVIREEKEEEKEEEPVEDVTIQEETGRPIRNILSRIFRRKTETETEKREQEPQAMESGKEDISDVEKTLPPPRFIRKTISRLKSVNYVYRKIDGLDEKCKQLISTPYGILTSTNKGLYVISDHKAEVIVPDRYVNFISDRSEDDRYYIACDDGYFFVAANSGEWYAVFPDYNFRDPLYSIVPVSIRFLWAGGNNAAIRIDLQQGPGYRIYQAYSDYSLEYFTDYVNDTVLFFTEDGINYYDVNTDSLILYRGGKTDTGAGADYVISQPGSPWMKLGEEWLKLDHPDKAINTYKSLLWRLPAGPDAEEIRRRLQELKAL